MKLNFNKLNDEVIKFLLKKERKELIITGSYALYKIHYNQELEWTDKIELKDLDLDIYQLLKNNDINTNKTNEIIIQIYEDYVFQLFDGLDEYNNIDEYDVTINFSKLTQRKWNEGTKGVDFVLKIKEHEGKTHYLSFDLNFENKNFKTINKNIILNNEKLQANVYEIHKTLADKYLAVLKRIDIIKKDFKNDKRTNVNIQKIGKDIYDIKYIKENLKYLDGKELDKNLDLMLGGNFQKQIKNIIKWVDKTILLHTEFDKNREGNHNIKLNLKQINEMLEEENTL